MLTWIKSGTGELAAAIDQAENRLGVKLPAAYRTMLEEHSGGESEELESMLITVDLLPMSEYPVFPCMVGWDKADLKKVIPIFETQEGKFYALDYTQGEVPGVLNIDYECDELLPERRYLSFETFIANIGRQKPQLQAHSVG